VTHAIPIPTTFNRTNHARESKAGRSSAMARTGSSDPLHGNGGTRVTLLTYQVAKTRRIGSAAAKCSNQADLHLTFIDPA